MVNVLMFTMNKRELIKDLVAKGFTTNQIVTQTGIPVGTIRYYREKSKQNGGDRIGEHRRKTKRKAISYSGGRCVKCGYANCDAALDFHHINPNEKEFKLSSGRTFGWDKMKAEIDKTILICANCHRELHSEQWEPSEQMVLGQKRIRMAYSDKPLVYYANGGIKQECYRVTDEGHFVDRVGSRRVFSIDDGVGTVSPDILMIDGDQAKYTYNGVAYSGKVIGRMDLPGEDGQPNRIMVDLDILQVIGASHCGGW